jgi:DHA3 family macrolide efflux protein-like MFS transporter
MLIVGVVLGLLLGLWAGGSIGNLATIRLRWVPLLFAAVVVRVGTEALLNAGIGAVDAFRVPLMLVGFGILIAGLWVNRSYPGLSLAFVGILLNAVVILVNGGFMPIWAPSLQLAGYAPSDVNSAVHVIVGGALDADFLVRAVFLGDIIPVPIPIIRNVASLGDLFLTLGLAFFLFASVVRLPQAIDDEELTAGARQLGRLAGATRLRRSSGFEALTSRSDWLSRSLAAFPAEPPVGPTAPTLPTIPIPRPSPEAVARVRRHPYARLAVNGSFSALWAGQLVSLFGDRIHQLALAAVVLISTGSALATALVFVAATLPNLLFSPVAGALVDRWDHKEVLVVSDLLRAAAVLLVPIAAATNVVFIYPLMFLITTISVFFRPARVAILPRIVRRDELLTANSALWVGETMADIVGYPLAGLFIVALGTALPLAFWLDAATYIGSAALLSTIIVVHGFGDATEREEAAADGDPGGAAIDELPQGILGELKAGWRFLRGEPVLLANTLQASVAQLMIGILIALTPVYALHVFGREPIGWQAVYSFIETGQSLGSLIGGFVIGLIGARFAKGRMIIVGYTVFGLLLVLFALSNNLNLVLGLSVGVGVTNMIFLIPSQTLFQERTPPGLMGRVVGFRFSLVFGSMTLAMAVGGLLAEVVGVTAVIALFGFVTMVAGLAGVLVPGVRDA